MLYPCIFLQACIHIHTHTHMHTYMHAEVDMCRFAGPYVHESMHAKPHTPLPTYKRMHIDKCACTYYIYICPVSVAPHPSQATGGETATRRRCDADNRGLSSMVSTESLPADCDGHALQHAVAFI